MMLLLISPVLALYVDYLRQKFSISSLWTVIIIFIITIPTLVIWLTSYSYSSTLGNNIGIMLFITGTIFAGFSFANGELKSKLILTIILLIVSGIVIFLISLFSIFSQHTDNIFSKTSSHNYKAIYSRDFDLVLAGPKRVTIKKTKIYGLIEKTIYSELITSSDTKPTCTLNVRHGNKKLSFDYCKNTLMVSE